MCFLSQIFAQQVTLYRVNVEGNTTTSDKMIKYSAGLRDGTQIQRSDISTAITRLWDLGLFEDVNIVLNNESQYGVEITIKVSESPILNQVLFEGMTVREGRFREKIELKSGQRIKPNSVEKATRKIAEIYKDDGYFNVEISSSFNSNLGSSGIFNFNFAVCFFCHFQFSTTNLSAHSIGLGCP